jgi:two-component system nitrate/nitrite response regulator NarL
VTPNSRIQILLYTQQPFVARGVSAILHRRAGFKLTASCESLAQTIDCLRNCSPHIVLVYLTSRISLAELRELQIASGRAQIVLWGQDLGGEFAFQAIQLGIRGILAGDTTIDGVLTAVQNVHSGVSCFQKDLVDSVMLQQRVTLTKRQGQLVSLVAQGYKNKQIAASLGITEGTVKFYLYKLFKKLGMNDRLDMALYGLRHLHGGQAHLERVRMEPRRARAAEPFSPRMLPPRTREQRTRTSTLVN